jgi:hypothetical protein
MVSAADHAAGIMWLAPWECEGVTVAPGGAIDVGFQDQNYCRYIGG